MTDIERRILENQVELMTMLLTVSDMCRSVQLGNDCRARRTELIRRIKPLMRKTQRVLQQEEQSNDKDREN